MKRIFKLFFLSLLLLPASSLATSHSFAIIIDRTSLEKAGPEIEAYAKAIEQKQGLKVYTIIDKWQIPDSIRTCLYKLYKQKKESLVGAVFIGDIPIPMIRDAQHMCSAFKLNQKVDRRESSVPSDRYYDDFKLTFKNEGRDDIYPYFYYSLTAQGSQILQPDIFSGRIRPTDAGTTSRYEKLKQYLRKAVQFKQNPEKVNSIFIFNGHGSLTESNVAHIDEFRGLAEHFPTLSQKQESFSYMQHNEEPFIKEKMENELMRPDLSLAILHHHGDWDTQYLGAYPQPRNVKQAIEYIRFNCRDNIRFSYKRNKNLDSLRQQIAKETEIPAMWIADAGTPEREHQDSLIIDKENLTLKDFTSGIYQPNCRLINFDACYNGSFHKEDCIANEYIFQPGKTLVAFGGSVNILQDKWPDRFWGLLTHGIMAGYILQNTSYLEWHLIGDPTFAFAPEKGSSDINTIMAENTDKQWAKILNKSKVADLQCMAIFKLSQSNLLSNKRLLNILQTSPYAIVRLESFLSLKKRGGDDFIKAMQIASRDNFELLQRFSVNEMQNNGDPRIVPSLMRLITKNNASARVKFNAIQALQFEPTKEINKAMEQQLDSLSPYIINKEDYRAAINASLKRYAGSWDEDISKLLSDTLNIKHALMQVNFMRIYLPAYLIPNVAKYTATCKNSEVQKDLLEALGWHGTAYTVDYIRKVAKQLSENKNLPTEVQQEAMKTWKRVSGK